MNHLCQRHVVVVAVVVVFADAVVSVDVESGVVGVVDDVVEDVFVINRWLIMC